jgi:hypothetical protein
MYNLVSPSKIGGGSELEVNGGVRICFTVVAAIVLFVEVKNERK